MTTSFRFVAPVSTNSAILHAADPQVAAAMDGEAHRQESQIVLIASENYASTAVLAAQGSLATNKYAEGYPDRRYYGGCQNVDVMEKLAIERACRIFGAVHVNVQPHSGSTANMAVYDACVAPGSVILGMQLAAGGHLTHGHKVSFSGKRYQPVQYGVNPTTGLIDLNEIESLAQTNKPAMIVVGASAYSHDFDYEALQGIAGRVGALLWVDMAHPAGLIAAGLLKNPLEWADIVSTTTHKTLRGPRGGMVLLGKDRENPLGLKTAGKTPRVLRLSEVIDSVNMPGNQGGPLMHVIAAKAVAFGEVLQDSFKDYGRAVIANAQSLAGDLMELGYHVVSGGTDNHVFLVDLRTKHAELDGKEAERLLGQAGIDLNANMVPGDNRGPFKPSGIRVGTAALTTRNMGVDEMRLIAGWIDQVLSHPTDDALRASILAQVNELTARFPMYREV